MAIAACSSPRSQSSITGIARPSWTRPAGKRDSPPTLGAKERSLRALRRKCLARSPWIKSAQELDLEHRLVMNEIAVAGKDFPIVMDRHCTKEHVDGRSTDACSPALIACASRFFVVLHRDRSEEHTSELQSPCNLVCRLLLE